MSAAGLRRRGKRHKGRAGAEDQSEEGADEALGRHLPLV